MPKPVLIAASLAALCLSAGPARADELQNQLVAAAKGASPSAYSFRRAMTIQQTGKPRKILVEQYDPRRPAADQWSLVSVDGRAPTAKPLKQECARNGRDEQLDEGRAPTTRRLSD